MKVKQEQKVHEAILKRLKPSRAFSCILRIREESQGQSARLERLRQAAGVQVSQSHSLLGRKPCYFYNCWGDWKRQNHSYSPGLFSVAFRRLPYGHPRNITILFDTNISIYFLICRYLEEAGWAEGRAVQVVTLEELSYKNSLCCIKSG
ncbi:hypothetical protein FCM35_KLT11506 [Carex littledalei]|uniref:Uncharacterized protein n=1 Tax=Carex littledalei TaxID=544730 RepID=A0A833QKB6_9POAL|nr:hypothetical protein FCM35_KLT11506 [Carex littledalei]